MNHWVQNDSGFCAKTILESNKQPFRESDDGSCTVIEVDNSVEENAKSLDKKTNSQGSSARSQRSLGECVNEGLKSVAESVEALAHKNSSGNIRDLVEKIDKMQADQSTLMMAMLKTLGDISQKLDRRHD